MRFNSALVSSLLFLLIVFPRFPADAAEKNEELIPRNLLFSGQGRHDCSISPDGNTLFYFERGSDKKQFFVLHDIASGAVRKTDTRDMGMRGRCNFSWAGDSRHVIVNSDMTGNENTELFSIDIDRKKLKMEKTVSVRDVQIRVISTQCEKYPRRLLIAMNKENRQRHDIYALDLDSGKYELEAESPSDTTGLYIDHHNLKLRGIRRSLPDGGSEIHVRDLKTGSWKVLITCGYDEDARIVRFCMDGKSAYILHNLKTDVMSLYRMDMESGREELVFHPEKSDIDHIIFSSENDSTLMIRSHYERPQWHFLDPDLESEWENLSKLGIGNIIVMNNRIEDPVWLVHYNADTVPGEYHLYHRAEKRFELLFRVADELKEYSLAGQKPVIIPSRDGLPLVSYLTLPVKPIPGKKPLVLLVHGGPWERDVWECDPAVQWLADRGYAVLNVNFRGSRGFGKKFLNAGNREWGRNMLNDLIDAAEWAVKNGYAERDRIGIFGASYGGYAALAAAAFTSGRFACAVDLCGISDVNAFIRSAPPYWNSWLGMVKQRIGDPDTDREMLREVSPAFHADKIEIPMLIGQGRNDPRVNFLESRKVVSQLRGRSKDVFYLEFQDEGHGLAYPENRRAFFAACEEFLARHLGGRFQPPTKQEEKIIKKVSGIL